MRRRTSVLALTVLVLAGLGTGAWFLLREPPDPRADIAAAASAYLDAWEDRDWPALTEAVRDEPGDTPELLQSMIDALRITTLTTDAGEVVLEEGVGDRGTVPFEVTTDLEGLGTWVYDSELEVSKVEDEWLVDWDPAIVHGDWTVGSRFGRTRTWPERAPIRDHEGRDLTAPRPVVAIGIQGSAVRDEAALTDALVSALDVTEEEVAAALADAAENPDWFIEVAVLDRAAYDEVRSVVHPVPGTVFEEREVRSPPDDAFARHILGRVGPITAELLERFGAPYLATDRVGRFGLELAYEQQLAGRPSGTVRLLDEAGVEAAVLHEFPGTEPEPLSTTLDLEVQQAVDAAVADVAEPVGFVVVDPATGAVRAAASRPLGEFDRALSGGYPPGSTFKTITAAAALAAGVTPDTTVSCPAEVSIGGRVFGNAHDLVLGDIPFGEAFEESCNTAFVQVAADLDEGALGESASRFGFGTSYSGFPIPVRGGEFPEPSDVAERAAAAIGQGRVTASPLHMATVAATVASGAWQQPFLTGVEPEGDGQPLPPRDTLAALMRRVVTGGTGTAAEVAGFEVRGKTGTAEFGEPVDGELPTHAWFIGFTGGTTDQLAFAVVVEGGGGGGAVAAPIAARFLANLPGS